MKLNNVEHINISDAYKIFTDAGEFVLTVTMHPQTEKEPTMKVTKADGADVTAEVEAEVVQLFISASGGTQVA
jgi:hypothetical protein